MIAARKYAHSKNYDRVKNTKGVKNIDIVKSIAYLSLQTQGMVAHRPMNHPFIR